MRSFLETKPKFGVTPFLKIFLCKGIFTHMSLRLPLKIALPPIIADGILELVSYYHHLFSNICHVSLVD